MTSYTKEELREFDRITDRLSGRSQLDRIDARFDLKRFIEKHGKEKCDEMFQELTRRDRAGEKQ